MRLCGGKRCPALKKKEEEEEKEESLDIDGLERFHSRRAILDLEQVAPLLDGGLLRTFKIDGESV